MAEREMPNSEETPGVKAMRKNYPGNSNTAKAESNKGATPEGEGPEKKMEKVISGNVVTRRKGLGRKIAETFGGGEDIPSVGNFLLLEVAVPALKNLISEIVATGVERTLFGEGARRGGATSRTIGRSFTNYGNFSRGGAAGRASEPDGPRQLGYRARANHDFNDVVLENRGEAEEVIDALREAISVYQVATVADLYDLVGITPKFTDQKWGWLDLRDAGVERVRDGYLLRLPRTEQVD